MSTTPTDAETRGFPDEDVLSFVDRRAPFHAIA